ncbi:glycosyltransferase family 4 protein [Fuchsiella alkaliacetigena]|uniref:glycosyltransferase family 4 protein n=1 Tax=Fuchsiella alkaliacetigena TaxID=957042 RepID=UPI00200A6C25|nr:glycosyltransferase family 4 protein [Fuchsiella alkaliacetigena]MCK8825916.1 glycosyltransferase family 4 protein [Fuchsiella alkaliacetigena]
MKKILHILTQRPEQTGSGIYLQSLLQEADKKGYQQAVIAGVPEQMAQVDLGQIDLNNFYPVKFESEQLPFPVVGMSDVMPYQSTRFKDLDEQMLDSYLEVFKEKIREAVQEFKPDLIIAHHLWLVTSLARQSVPEIPLLAICHGTGLRQLKQLHRFRDYVVLGCREVDTIFALTEHQKEEISQLYAIDEERIVVMGSGYNNEFFYIDGSKREEQPIKLVYVGKMSYAKGVRSLLRAYNSLEVAEELELILIGSGSGVEAEKIKQLAKDCTRPITFTGALPQSKVGEIFRKADIFCLASFYEGLGLVLMEALASGLRVVSSDLPGVKEWLGPIINNSGVIEYVELPTLKEVDIPVESELPDFEKRFKKAIEKQISKLGEDHYLEDEEYLEAVSCFSWSGLLARMEAYF